MNSSAIIEITATAAQATGAKLEAPKQSSIAKRIRLLIKIIDDFI